MLSFIDAHAHIYQEYYDSISDIIAKINKASVTRIINAGCDKKSNMEVLELASKYPSLYAAIGIHPESVDVYKEDDLLFIENNLHDKKVVAIGEIGLDYHYTKDNRLKQIKLFESQLAMAEKYNMPVVVHSREATEDTINCIRKFKVTGIIHSFSGSIETARIYEKLGFLLSVNGVITFKNSNLKNVIKEIDIRNIVLETDSPYLTPDPNRGQKNDSSNLIYIAVFLAKLYNIELKKVSEITNKNVYRIFDKLC